jgi:hypothetical protein
MHQFNACQSDRGVREAFEAEHDARSGFDELRWSCSMSLFKDFEDRTFVSSGSKLSAGENVNRPTDPSKTGRRPLSCSRLLSLFGNFHFSVVALAEQGTYRLPRMRQVVRNRADWNAKRFGRFAIAQSLDGYQ